MATSLNELKIKIEVVKDEMQNIVEEQRKILDHCEGQSRAMLNDTEETTYNVLDKRYNELEKQRGDLQHKISQKEAGYVPAILMGIPEYDQNEENNNNKKTRGNKTMGLNFNEPELRNFVRYLRTGEMRDLQKDFDAKGGFAVTPLSIQNEIITGLNNDVAILNLARKFVMKADSKGLPCMQTDISDPSFKGEITELDWDSSLDLEQRVLYPHRLVKGIKVSRDLLMLSEPDMAAFVISRLQYKLAVTMESTFMTGTGPNEPLGIFTISASGITSGRDVTTGNTSTALTADGLINCLYGLKGQYLRSKSCRWILHRNILKMIRKMKTGEGDYIWKAGIADNTAPTILGIPYVVSEYAPSAPTSGQRAAVVGDMNFYGAGFYENEPEVRVLDQLFAATNQNGYTIQIHVDGMPLCSEAFSCATLA